jgi:hypothetical protein
MARQLDDIFNECYERIRSGESLKSCLKRYPKHAAELEPLLKTAFDIGRRASYIHPRPEFKHWARVQFEGRQHHARQRRQPAKPGLFSWRQSWSVAVAAVLILVLTGSSTAIASSNALPDEPLYPVKLATEDMRLAFAVSDTQKAQVHTQLAETRAVELETMADQGKTEPAAITAARLAKQLEMANSAIARVESNVGTAPPPTIPEEQPAVTEEQPPVTEEQPPVTEEQPPVTEEQPPVTEEQPPVTEEQPAVTEEQPPVTEEQPPVTEEQPPVTEEQPPVTEEQPPVTEEQPPVTEEQPAVTEEQPPVTEEQPPVTEEQPPVTEEQPPVTEEQPPVTEEQPTPPAFTTRDKGVTAKTERFKKSLENSTSKSLKALESAMEKAPLQAKPNWQRAIDAISESGHGKPTPVWPSQPTPQSDNITWDQGKPNPFSPSNNQPSSSESQNTGNKDWPLNKSQTNWPNKGTAK